MIDTILIFVAGMIIGGFIYVKLESIAKEKGYRLLNFGRLMSFLSVFFISVNYLTVKYIFLYGLCCGVLIFSFIPQMSNNDEN